MFKNVQYIGFEGRPELQAKAEQLTPVLMDQIHRWREGVNATWAPHPNDPARSLNLSLALALPGGDVEGTALGTFTPADLAEAWLTRSRCRDVWSDVLEDISRKLDVRMRENLSELVEA